LLNKAINISIYNVFNPANKNISGQYDHEGHRLAEAGGTFSWFLMDVKDAGAYLLNIG
jgi:hypothetical protein